MGETAPYAGFAYPKKKHKEAYPQKNIKNKETKSYLYG